MNKDAEIPEIVGKVLNNTVNVTVFESATLPP